MQNERQSDGVLRTLPHMSVDTGMGLERVCAVLQGMPTNFDSDVFQPLMDAALDVLHLPSSGTWT
jgi:alanyl-tRNA synthetase